MNILEPLVFQNQGQILNNNIPNNPPPFAPFINIDNLGNNQANVHIPPPPPLPFQGLQNFNNLNQIPAPPPPVNNQNFNNLMPNLLNNNHQNNNINLNQNINANNIIVPQQNVAPIVIQDLINNIPANLLNLLLQLFNGHGRNLNNNNINEFLIGIIQNLPVNNQLQLNNLVNQLQVPNINSIERTKNQIFNYMQALQNMIVNMEINYIKEFKGFE